MTAMMTTMPAIKIVVPVHEEEGWTTHSPDSAITVKARLEESKQTKARSPEAQKQVEERAERLHNLYVEARAASAAITTQRAKEVAAARLRLATTQRQNLLSKFDEEAKHRE